MIEHNSQGNEPLQLWQTVLWPHNVPALVFCSLHDIGKSFHGQCNGSAGSGCLEGLKAVIALSVGLPRLEKGAVKGSDEFHQVFDHEIRMEVVWGASIKESPQTQ